MDGDVIPIEREEPGPGLSDVYRRLLSRRVVFLGSDLDGEGANLAVAQLVHLESEDAQEPIRLYINSSGSDLSAALAVYDAMQHVAPSVETTCIGVAGGVVAVVLAGGASGRRRILPHARVMIHQPRVSPGVEGQATDIAIHAREIGRMRDQMAEVLALHTGKTVDEVRGDLERDRWLSAAEAVEYGLVEEVAAGPPNPGLVGTLSVPPSPGFTHTPRTVGRRAP